MHDLIASSIESIAIYSQTYPIMFCALIVLFMAIESSFIPFPSEVVMIPAGFLVAHNSIITGNSFADLIIIIFLGLSGSMMGAYVNYYLSAYLGRPFLYRYGKYFFLKETALKRAEEIFREYGEMVTFVCRLLPAIRQLISIPAGLSKMNLFRFSLFTGLGAGIWVAILTSVGYYLGKLAENMDYQTLVKRGSEIINEHYIWIFITLLVFVAVYIYVHKKIMKSSTEK